ncbi:hypothetical protein V496_09273 [Pseudogymnoascus sp. VKM F-4515 (FW-2607)]|nr:hypothetical protein V496_09273 [Pseudogymnoascus sp. VKM F-4515 (FW-2607)]KFY96234.1 hypothetical protein V498_02791 [Pseudogymnoascus sp. VKM F-4517 (FW-2822)]
MSTPKDREFDRKWEMFDSDQFYQISELLRIAAEFKLCTGGSLVKDVTRAISKEVQKGVNTKMDQLDRQAIHAHPVLSQLLVYSRGLDLGPRSMLAEDIEIAVTKVILYHRVYPTNEEDSEPDSSLMTPQAKVSKKSESKTEDSDEATGDVVESGTKEKRNFFKEANDIAGDAKF